ncbi:hypothetical protein SALBM217S_02728 [Streptomyces griseoloalbus]
MPSPRTAASGSSSAWCWASWSPRSPRWWATARCCAGTSRGTWALVTAELSRSALRRGLPGRRKRRHAARTRLTSSLARTVRGSSEPLALLELGCARGAGAIALDLARTLGADEPVVVVDALPRHGPAGRRSKPGDVEVVGVERAAALPSDRRRIGVASVAPGAAWSRPRRPGRPGRAGGGRRARHHGVAAHRGAAARRPACGGGGRGAGRPGSPGPDGRDAVGRAVPGAAGPRGRPARQNGGSGSHAVQAVADGPRRTERLPMWAARIPDSDQEAR